MESPPMGFLFLCPPTDFHTGPSSFCWPDSPAYWSLDPSGAEHLTTVDAKQLRFPSLQLTTAVLGMSWNASVYAGLRQFYLGKGFDPESLAVARHLGYPLYELSSEVDPPFAHGKSIIVKQSVLFFGLIHIKWMMRILPEMITTHSTATPRIFAA
jgi:hypothetical protein